MPGLILEGGTFRPIFTCGLMDALLAHDLMFDYVIGVSAGITNAFSYVSRQSGRNLEIMRRYRNDPRYLSPFNYLRCSSMFGLDFVFDEIPNRLLPFDWDAFRAYNGRIRVGVTNARTGEAEYLDGAMLDEKCTMLRATCAIPLYFPAIQIGDELYYDGGLADSIPIRHALLDGSKKNLIVLTQPAGYRKTLSPGTRAAATVLRHRYPKMTEVMRSRPQRYNETVCLCEQLAAHRPEDTVLIRPQAPINSFESDVSRLEAVYHEGWQAAEAHLPQIQRLFD